jgi:nitrogen regulatory protein PII
LDNPGRDLLFYKDLVVAMKKIEAVMERPEAEILLANIRNDSLPALAEVTVIESQIQFCKLRHSQDHEPEWQPCVKLDLFVPDCETQSAVEIIRERSHVPKTRDSNINVFPIEATLEISARKR